VRVPLVGFPAHDVQRLQLALLQGLGQLLQALRRVLRPHGGRVGPHCGVYLVLQGAEHAGFDRELCQDAFVASN
jgi:hypothetical protein